MEFVRHLDSDSADYAERVVEIPAGRGNTVKVSNFLDWELQFRSVRYQLIPGEPFLREPRRHFERYR